VDDVDVVNMEGGGGRVEELVFVFNMPLNKDGFCAIFFCWLIAVVEGMSCD